MIFLAITIFWIIVSSSFLHLVIVVPIYFSRSIYLSGRIALPYKIFFISWLLIVLFQAVAFPDQPIEGILLYVLKIMLSGIMILDYLRFLVDSPMRKAPFINQVWLFFDRALIALPIEVQRGKEWRLQYERAQAVRSQTNSLMAQIAKKFGIWARMTWLQALSFLLMSMAQVDQQGAVINAKGGFPRSHDWMVPSSVIFRRWWLVAISDVLIYVLICATLFSAADVLMPPAIIDAIHSLSAMAN